MYLCLKAVCDMDIQQTCRTDSEKIARAIEHLRTRFGEPLTPETWALRVGLSEPDFRAAFERGTGTSAEVFLRCCNSSLCGCRISSPGPWRSEWPDRSLENAVSERTNGWVVQMERIASGKSESRRLRYSFGSTLWGPVLVASTDRGVCFLGFADDAPMAWAELERQFPNAVFQPQTDEFQREVLDGLQAGFRPHAGHLHLVGTPFQLQVWTALRRIPRGAVVSYGELARGIGRPKACRAVGSAVGANPVSWLVPCHRVVQASGAIGHYRWGEARKHLLLAWEAALCETDSNNSISVVYENHDL